MTLEITHRAYVLEHGRVVMEGPSRELKQNEYVRKAYLGHLNRPRHLSACRLKGAPWERAQ